MKKEKEYIATSLWYKEEINDPNQVIAEFFSAADITDYRKDIYQIIRAAYSKKHWQRGSPGDLLFQLKSLESVINAAFIINQEEKESPLHIEIRDIFNPNLFRGTSSTHTDWDFFPRALSYREFVNPYLSFKRFFKYQELAGWKVILEELSEYALITTSIFEEVEGFDCLLIYRQLLKVIEAAHLIDVRENTHRGGYIKNRMLKREY